MRSRIDQTDRVEKRVVRSRIDQTDRVEKRVVRSRIDQTDRVEKRVVRSRIDQTDRVEKRVVRSRIDQTDRVEKRVVRSRIDQTDRVEKRVVRSRIDQTDRVEKRVVRSRIDQTDRVEKRVVRSRIDQTDRVEKRVVRSRIDQTDRVEKRVVRSRIDQTDPNPAHKLKHSLEELTLSYGRTVNPRFAEKKDRNKLYRRHSTSVVDPVTSKETPGGKRTLKKSVTLGALPATEPSVLQELTKSQLTEITEETPHSDPTEETPHSDPTEEPPHSDPTEETPHSDPTEEPPHSNRIEETPYSEATEESEAMDGKSSPRESLEETSLYQTIDTSQPQHDGLNERKDKPAIANGNAHSLSEESPPPSPPPVEDDLVVTDIEVTHTETSTTVILSHLWGRSSLAGENQLSTIDEGEDNYYEVEDDPEDRVLAAVSAATLPHGIPKLCVTDETGELVEVLVDPQAESERAGQLSEEHADELQDNLSELVINCNGDSSFDDTSTSTRL